MAEPKSMRDQASSRTSQGAGVELHKSRKLGQVLRKASTGPSKHTSPTSKDVADTSQHCILELVTNSPSLVKCSPSLAALVAVEDCHVIWTLGSFTTQPSKSCCEAVAKLL